MLASNGAKRFAEKHGFRTVPLSHLLAPETVEAFHQWKKEKAKGIIMNEAGGAGLMLYSFLLKYYFDPHI